MTQKTKPVTEMFEEAFSLSRGSIRGVCEWCGRTYFNGADSAFFDPGEYEALLEKAKSEPDKYIEVDHTLGFYQVDGREAVIGCPCHLARRFEDFIWNERIGILKYLETRLRVRAEVAAEEKAKVAAVGASVLESLGFMSDTCDRIRCSNTVWKPVSATGHGYSCFECQKKSR